MDIPKKTKITQQERILKYIEKNGFIDRKIAAYELGIFELPARIVNLRKKGYSFDKTRKSGISKFDGHKFSYMEYRLKQYDAINSKDQVNGGTN